MLVYRYVETRGCQFEMKRKIERKKTTINNCKKTPFYKNANESMQVTTQCVRSVCDANRMYAKCQANESNLNHTVLNIILYHKHLIYYKIIITINVLMASIDVRCTEHRVCAFWLNACKRCRWIGKFFFFFFLLINHIKKVRSFEISNMRCVCMHSCLNLFINLSHIQYINVYIYFCKNSIE